MLCHFHNPDFEVIAEQVDRCANPNDAMNMQRMLNASLPDKFISCVRQLLNQGKFSSNRIYKLHSVCDMARRDERKLIVVDRYLNQALHHFHTKWPKHWTQTFIETSNSIRGATHARKLCPKPGTMAAGIFRFVFHLKMQSLHLYLDVIDHLFRIEIHCLGWRQMLG